MRSCGQPAAAAVFDRSAGADDGGSPRPKVSPIVGTIVGAK
jgi:hypothetical protein